MNRRADKTADFVDGFFRRHPKLSKYRSRLRFREREQGGSAGHGEARQHGNEVWLFPKFWQHTREVQDFVLAHEVGHWVKSEFGGREFIALAESKGIDPWDSPNLPFGQFNMDEAFADAFASYYTDGDVRRRYPAWAQLVEAMEAGERPMRIARNKSKKDTGHGGLDEWFSGHGEGKGKAEGKATWGDWVAISPVKKKVKQELADGTVKEKTVQPGDIVGPCGVSDDPNWKAVTKGGKDPLKCMPRQKAHDTPKKERAELAREKLQAERDEGNSGKKPTRTRTFDKEAAVREVMLRTAQGDNEPNDPALWEKAKGKAKKRYKKWPSAYAVGHALKIYKDEGGGWRKKKSADTTGKGWRRILASNLRPPCDPSEHGYAFIEPSGKVHLLNMSHPKWAENYLADHPELGAWYERVGGLLKHGWIRVANITNLSVAELNTPPKAAWKAVLDMVVDCVRKGMDPDIIIRVDHGVEDQERSSAWTAADFARRFGGRVYEDAVFEAALSRPAVRRASVSKHTLPKLPYPYDGLEPHVSEETLRQHHDKHHKAYVDGLNKAEKALAGARDDGDYEAVPALNAALQFHAGGHHLHSLYWPSLTPPSDYEEPSDALVEAVEQDFGSWEAFRAQMKESTVKVRGSGWGVLVLTPAGLRVVTVMNHENGVLWDGVVLLPIDAWEHAYYLDYQSDREAHFDAVFDNLVKWPEVERRLQDARRTVQKKQARAVAARYFLHQEVRRMCASRVASREGARVRRELTPEVMLAFVEASGVRVASMKVAFDMVKKVKQLWEAFTSQPGAWERFKRVIGVKADGLLGALKELPRKIVELGKRGKELMHKLGGWLVEHVPFFRIYSEARGKMPALNTYIIKLVDYLPPRIAGALKAVGKKAHDLAAVLDEYVEKHPVAAIAGTGASAALFTVIWLNVTEISWDLGDLVRGFLGMYSFAELLKSLPEAGVGFMLSLLFPGLPSRYLLNALLPVTVALRVAWLVGQHYASWERGSLVVHWEKLGVEPPSDGLLPPPA